MLTKNDSLFGPELATPCIIPKTCQTGRSAKQTNGIYLMDEQVIIEFSNFSFQYYSQAEPTLHEINLKIRRGEKILIVGPQRQREKYTRALHQWVDPFRL